MRALSICAAAITALTLASAALADAPTPAARYDSVIANLKAAGIATTLADIYPASAPDDQNAAPLYAKMASSTADQSENDALAVLGASPTDSDWAKAQAFVDGNAKLIDLVHKAAAMPDCVVPGRANAPDPAAILFPEFAPMRRAVRILAVESAVEAHDGHGVDAVENAVLGFKIADQAYQEPNLIGWLVGVACDAVTVRNIEHIMTMNSGDPAVLSAASTTLSAWRPHKLFAAFSGETAFAAVEIASMQKSDYHALVDLASGEESDVPPSLRTAAHNPAAWRDFVDENGVTLLGYYKNIIDAADDPYPASSKELQAIDNEIGSAKGDQYTLTRIMCPAFTKVVDKQAQIEATVDVAQACAALLAYRDANGSYPGSLSQAMPTVPVDPFDGQAIGYRPDGQGFVLYSAGSKGQYAGGSDSTGQTVLRVSGDGFPAWK